MHIFYPFGYHIGTIHVRSFTLLPYHKWGNMLTSGECVRTPLGKYTETTDNWKRQTRMNEERYKKYIKVRFSASGIVVPLGYDDIAGMQHAMGIPSVLCLSVRSVAEKLYVSLRCACLTSTDKLHVACCVTPFYFGLNVTLSGGRLIRCCALRPLRHPADINGWMDEWVLD